MKARHRRFAWIGAGVVLLGVAAALVLNAFQSNLVFFFTPSQVAAKEAPQGRTFRIGGLVEEKSLQREKDGLTVRFNVTDTAKTIPVVYTGILPDLFKEGKGVVAQGTDRAGRRLPRDRGACQARRELHAARGRRRGQQGARRRRRRKDGQDAEALTEDLPMIPEIGHFALILALLLATVLGTLPLVGAQRAHRRLDGARPARGAGPVPVRRRRLLLPRLFVRDQRLLGRQRRHQLELAAAARSTGSPRPGARTRARCCCGC